MQLNHPIMDSDEYKELFKKTKAEYPHEYDYFLHIACIAHLVENKTCDIIKSDVNIETQDEI